MTAAIPLVLAGASKETQGRAERWAEFIRKLARVSEISSAASAPQGSAQLVVRGEVADTVLDRYSDDRLTAYWTVTSPMSTESKRLVFHSEDADRLECDMKMYRRIAADMSLPTTAILFLSDVRQELDAAAEAGMRTGS